MNIYEEVRQQRDRLVALRREIHSHPELGWQETHTQALICRELDELEIPYEKVCGTGVIATIRGGVEKPVIAFCADMDALPITEKSTCEYASQNPGVMHACGHDCHVAWLLMTARVLKAHAAELKCTVKLIFQPAEECIEGARAMYQLPQLDDVEHIFGAHAWIELPVGAFSVETGPRMASADNIYLTIRGKSAHGAQPQDSIDAIVAACGVVQALQTVVSRNNDPRQPFVVTIGTISGGTSSNIIANEVKLSGTVRSFDPAVRDRMEKRLEEVSKAAAAVYGAECEFTYRRCTPAMINCSAETELMRRAVSQVFGQEALQGLEKSTGGEDFAWFLERIPGSYVRVGARNEAAGKCWPHHHECFDVDEEALVNGAAVFCQTALLFGQERSGL